MPEASPGDAVVRWAASQARIRLLPLGNRWLHVQAVAGRARVVAPTLPASDRPCLLAAAYLHDIGWAPELVETEFHPLDGARWLQRQGFPRLARLVAHHSAARFEAELRCIGHLLRTFQLEESDTADALTYCDITTGPTGQIVMPEERWAEITERYGQGTIVVQALARARPSLEKAVQHTERRLRALKGQPM